MEESKIDFEKEDFPFLSKTNPPQIKQVFDFRKLLCLRGYGEVLAYLYQGLGRSLTYVGPVLDLDLPCGFNDHTDRHTLWVSWNTIELLKSAGLSFDGKNSYDRATENLATTAAVLHDLGNFMGRSTHSQFSLQLLHQLFSHYRGRKEKRPWRFLEEAVFYHDGDALSEAKFDIAVQPKPLLWALILADKLHFGRDRIGGRSQQKGIEGVYRDVHILLNALVSRSDWTLSPSGFVWQLDFEVRILDEEMKKFAKKGKQRVWVDKKMQDNFKNEGIPYRETFADLFLDIYKSRFDYAALSAFLLFPWVRSFTLRIFDNDLGRKVGSGILDITRYRRELISRKVRAKRG